MNYPLISEYLEAITSSEFNFATLTNLRPVLGEDENPVMTSGNFAVVFKMEDEQSGKFYAVKCFLKDQSNRDKSYKMIADELGFTSSTYLVHFKYLEKELFVDTNNSDEEEFPVLVMDWVNGVTLDRYIRKNIDDQYALQMLAYQFSKLAMWLIPQPFAHGDIKPDNIIVRDDGSLVLIDYDGMFVPAMKGQKARELGSPDFRHPSRTEDDFDEHIDDFSLISMLLSLRAISNNPSLLNKYGKENRLLFCERNFRDISQCQLLKELYPSNDVEINKLIGLFTIASTQNNLSNISFRLLTIEKPEKPVILSTNVTEEDLTNAWVDDYGVMYSRDSKKLLRIPGGWVAKEYSIRQGTTCIGNYAFVDPDYGFTRLGVIDFPNTIISIGDSAFYNCIYLRSIILPNSLLRIGKNAFSCCNALKEIFIPSTVVVIGADAFWGCDSLSEIIIPSSVAILEDNPFANCKCKVINHSNNYCVIDGNVFTSDCTTLINHQDNRTSFSVPGVVKSIGTGAFAYCDMLKSITIPPSVNVIGKFAFDNCVSLKSIKIPNSVNSIGNGAFRGCVSLQSIKIPSSIIELGSLLFEDCYSLKSIGIPSSVKTIGFKAFSRSDLEEIVIPSSVEAIEPAAFESCHYLRSISLNSSIMIIRKETFMNCSSLESIVIPDSVTTIEDCAFEGCWSLQSIRIPDSIKELGKNVFKDCNSLHKISISHATFNRLKEKLIFYEDIISYYD